MKISISLNYHTRMYHFLSILIARPRFLGIVRLISLKLHSEVYFLASGSYLTRISFIAFIRSYLTLVVSASFPSHIQSDS